MYHKIWKIPYSKPYIPSELVDAGYSPLLAAALSLRGIYTADDARKLLDSDYECLHDPMLISGMDKAVERVCRAIRDREIIAVYGDYDVDGITSTCLLTDYIRYKGNECHPYIPDRDEEGYGLNSAALDHLRSKGVSLVITVDCGITAVEEAEHAKKLGMDMVITDHHECKSGALPDACAVIDCKQDGDNYPNKNLAGVGMALKLVCACEGNSHAMLERYADLVAVGTVADVMPLIDENRYLVRRGLEMLRRDPRPGISAMLREMSIETKNINASTVGYSLAPRLNAAGRLGQAWSAAELLMCSDISKAHSMAAELCELNRQRQNIETEIWREAQELISDATPDAPIVLASENWHQGVIGIAASRLAEQYSLPAIMICLNGDDGKGSCRSHGGFNLFEALSACAEHLSGFGGHALAAGLKIKRHQLDAFRNALAEYYRSNRPEPQPEVQCDLLIADPGLFTVESVRSLDQLEPFGNSNPKPIMCMNCVELESASAVGNGRHLKLRVRLGRSRFDGIFFSHTAQELDVREGDSVDVAFTPQVNEYKGHVSVQLLVTALRKHDPRELCEAILSGNDVCHWAASPFRPDRKDFVRVWKMMGSDFKVGRDVEAVIAQCPQDMAAERFCICLMTFMEAGLLSNENGIIYGAVCCTIDGKADLDNTNLMRSLRSQ